MPGIHLHANNLHECYERMTIDAEQDSANYQPGWFSDQTLFYISDFISKSEWQELIAHANEYLNNHFTFVLLHGAEIEGAATSAALVNQHNHAPIILSNDPDFCVLKLKQDHYPNAINIDLTPTTTYHNLIATLKDKCDQAGVIHFTYKFKGLLQALLNGQTIILNGAINSALYQQLLPYLYPESALIYHGNTLNHISGRLLCVMPTKAVDELSLAQYQVVNYTTADYVNALGDVDPLLIDNIELYTRRDRHTERLTHTYTDIHIY